MSSINRNDGYMLMDHRASPGIPESMLRSVGLPGIAGRGVFEVTLPAASVEYLNTGMQSVQSTTATTTPGPIGVGAGTGSGTGVGGGGGGGGWGIGSGDGVTTSATLQAIGSASADSASAVALTE